MLQTLCRLSFVALFAALCLEAEGLGQIGGALHLRGNAFIAGQVIDQTTGAGISDAIVTLTARTLTSQAIATRPGSAVRSEIGQSFTPVRIITNALGRFVFLGLPAGVFDMSATAPGYLLTPVATLVGPKRPIELSEGGFDVNVTIRMVQPSVIAGTLTDNTSEPVVGVDVGVIQRIRQYGQHRFLRGGLTATDDRGEYRLSGLLPGDYLVVVPGVQGGSGITDASASLLAQAPTPITSHRTTFYPGVAAAAEALVISVGAQSERRGIDFQVAPSPSVPVSGTVITPAGPVSGANVQLRPAHADIVGDAGFDSGTATTSPMGNFAFSAVTAGRYELTVVKRPGLLLEALDSTSLTTSARTSILGSKPLRPDGPWLFGRLTVVVEAKELADLVIPVQPMPRLRGRIQLEHTPNIDNALRFDALAVVLTKADGRPVAVLDSRTQPDTLGRFELSVHEPGRYRISVLGQPAGWVLEGIAVAGRFATDDCLELEGTNIEDVVVTMTNRVGHVAGTVFKSAGQAAITGWVIMFPADYRAWIETGMNPRQLQATPIMTGGKYTLTNIPVGRYLLAAIDDRDISRLEAEPWIDMVAPTATPISVTESKVTTINVIMRVVRQ